MPDKSKVTLQMVSSLDGFIATKDGSVEWLHSTDTYEKGIVLSDRDVEDLLSAIDCYVMGSRTYEHAQELGWPYGDKPVFVLSHRDLATDRENVEFISGDLGTILSDRIKPDHRNIWVVGGAAVARELIRGKLADEIVVSIMPVILGDGTLFFDFIGTEIQLHLKEVTTYRDGMVELWYQCNRVQ